MKTRTIFAIAVGIVVWGAAAKVYLDRRSEERRMEQARIERSKPQPPIPPTFGPGKGEFETYFKERDPLSNKPELLRRLMLRPEQLKPTTNPAMPASITEDAYEIEKQLFRIYVPLNYTPDATYGIIYYLGYKDTTATPPNWKSDLDQQHLIFITPENSIRPEWQQAAVALDAVHNLKAQYKIDEKRIYLFEFPPRPGLVGLQMGFGLADVFSGFAHIDRLEHYRNVPVPEMNRFYPPTLGTPPANLLAISKSRPHAFVLQNNFFVTPDGFDKRPYVHTALEKDGFSKLLFLNIADGEELHYANFHGTWLMQTLQFLSAQNDPATLPSSR